MTPTKWWVFSYSKVWGNDEDHIGGAPPTTVGGHQKIGGEIWATSPFSGVFLCLLFWVRSPLFGAFVMGSGDIRFTTFVRFWSVTVYFKERMRSVVTTEWRLFDWAKRWSLYCTRPMGTLAVFLARQFRAAHRPLNLIEMYFVRPRAIYLMLGNPNKVTALSKISIIKFTPPNGRGAGKTRISKHNKDSRHVKQEEIIIYLTRTYKKILN